MKIWMWPKTSTTNMYSELLSSSLERNGHSVEHFRWIYLFKLKKGEILHFHWIHRMYQSNIYLVQLFKIFIMIITLIFLKFKGIKLIWTVHNLYPHKLKYKKAEKFARKMVMFFCNNLIAAGEFIKDEIIKEYNINGNKIKVVPHGHYKEAYEETNYDYREQKDINRNSFVFLFIGAIKEYKGVEKLINTFKKIESKKATLVIAGKPDAKYDYLKQSNSENIVMDIRFIPDSEIVSIIQASNIVVLPYEEITTSGTAILATSFQRPIIAPKGRFFEEYFNEDMALLYENNSNEDLLSKMLLAMETDFNDEAFLELDNKLNWNHVAIETIKVYKRK
ncbi:hypothetical protein CHH91_00040 [Virgibacillus sp. 7505]|uniref:glycosyltransferase n=1 Tax=Virgibacillus sp. 7505 TaxID=2022548 RepID=UPI000BA7239B|nr:glycosyltransferase [Virgibacillus sp. 7505]PAE17932.1 hypothetical protein CHH91_00040 [Virgibacillus sp. 7505]